MKKTFCLFVCIALCLLAASALAVTTPNADPRLASPLMEPQAECPHDYCCLAAPASMQCASLGKSLHEMRAYTQAVCSRCGDAIQVYDASGFGPHQWQPSGDWHVAEGKHAFLFTCAQCGESDTILYPCPGAGRGDCPDLL